MTDFHKKNDDLLRDKLTQYEFAQVDGAWENMSKLLNQQQAVPKRIGGFWWLVPIVAAAVLIGIIGIGIQLNPKQTNVVEQTAPIAQQVDKTSTQTASKPLTTQTTATAKQPDKNPVIAALANAPRPTAEPLAQQQTKQNNIGTANNSQEKVVQTSSPKASDQEGNAKTTDKENVALANVIKANSPTTSVATNDVSTNTKRRVKTTRTEIIHQYSVTPLRAIQAKKDALKKQPHNTIGDFGIGDELNKKKCPVKIGVFGGASAKMYGQTQEFSVMPYAGVTATYKVAARHGVQVGLQYKSMGRLPSINKNDESKTLAYTNGTKTATSHSMNRIDMLEIPLVYQFYPHRRYNVHAGIKGAWLFNTETSSPAMQLTNEKMGIANFDVGMLLGMEFLLNKNWSLGVQYSFGFINLTRHAQLMHQAAIDNDQSQGINTYDKVQALSSPGEIIVPVSSDANHQEMIRLPNSLHNNDIQILLKYTF